MKPKVNYIALVLCLWLEAGGSVRRFRLDVRNAFYWLLRCRTSALGGHQYVCEGGHSHVRYNQCNHRVCAQCCGRYCAAWFQSIFSLILRCPHFHVIATISSDLRDLFRHNRKRMADLMFEALRQSIIDLLADRRYMGGTPGIVGVLHTWGQNLDVHPHLHFIVSMCGLSPEGELVLARKTTLLPFVVLGRAYRTNLLKLITREFKAKRLVLPKGTSRADFRRFLEKEWHSKKKSWHVEIFKRDAMHEVIRTIKYLARSIRGGPIRNERIVSIEDGVVTFKYTDYRALEEAGDQGLYVDPEGKLRQRLIQLDHDEFIRRWQEHIAPRGMQITRRFGLYANNASSNEKLNLARELLGQLPVQSLFTSTIGSGQAINLINSDTPKTSPCPQCGAPARRDSPIPPMRQAKPADPPTPLPRGPPFSRPGFMSFATSTHA